MRITQQKLQSHNNHADIAHAPRFSLPASLARRKMASTVLLSARVALQRDLQKQAIPPRAAQLARIGRMPTGVPTSDIADNLQSEHSSTVNRHSSIAFVKLRLVV
jgi:hypothetical protein